MSHRNKVFHRVGSAPVIYSKHNISYELKQDARFGLLYPVFRRHFVPGDRVSLGNEIVIRFNPMITPILHEINCFVHYFFVPYRILWDNWENFITGGEDGMDNSSQPTWRSATGHDLISDLYDYFHFDHWLDSNSGKHIDSRVLDYPRRAYNLIWNEYYRDEHLQGEVGDDSDELLFRSWEKDYFTSARPDTQLGESPAVPISGSVNFDLSSINNGPIGITYGTTASIPNFGGLNLGPGGTVVDFSSGNPGPTGSPITLNPNVAGISPVNQSLNNWLRSANINLLSANSFDVNMLREIWQIQRWKERNMRAGARYTEFIKSRFPAYPRDERLQRPEYIGGTYSPIIISEVLQTSNTVNQSTGQQPLADLAGHAITADKSFVGKYKVEEYGIIIGLMSIMPKPVYAQGQDREFIYDNRFDYYFPEFQHLGEQPVFGRELCLTASNYDESVFGYQGRYNELRYGRNHVCGLMRNDLAHWHMARYFDSGNPPQLNGDFLRCMDGYDMRNFAVTDEPPMIVNFGNICYATRPMVAVPNPGLVDHF